jgi:predicted negative regulator of RcsB-dependent stress response
MNRKNIITGALIALAAGLATFYYKKRRNKLSAAASDAYNTMDHTINRVERQTENAFS